ncbi:wall-associated receptor kinase 5-like [Zingiber officinale]|nr:wall-associated receptor kinase 5-like [Zingiber officinale]
MKFINVLLPLNILLIFVEGFISGTMGNENFTLPSNCSTTCGDIKIEYPFGIGSGCFRTVGFNLTCAYDSNPPRLLLGDDTIQVKNFDMDKGLVYIESPHVILNVDAQSRNSTLISLKNLPFSLRSRLVYSTRSIEDTSLYNTLYIFGCSATANILDVATTGTIDSCSTICSATNTTSTTEQRYTYGNGFCTLDLYNENFNHESWDIQLTRLNENENEHRMINNSTSNITAIIFDDESISDDDYERLINDRNTTGIMASLSWYISEYTTCKEAMKRIDTYACRSQKSECYDVLAADAQYLNETIGYNCQCSLDYVGNPYLPNGCQLGQNFTSTPRQDCQTKCGNVTIFFPFGLKKGCFRDNGFALTCNETSHPPTLLFQDFYVVSNMSLEEGQLEYHYPSDYIYYSYDRRRSHFASTKEENIIRWVVAYQSCKNATKDIITFACMDEHSICLDVNDTRDGQVMGYRCNCADGYVGNPYLRDGCKDIDECNSSLPACTGICINIEGGFKCICPPGTLGDPLHGACVSSGKKNLLLGVLVGVSIGTSLLVLCISLIVLSKKWKLRNQKKIRQRNFHQNHGLLLQQLISTSANVEEKTNIFSLEEIEKATNNFDETRILGRGGHGIVYKGILSDQRVVAIKKSKTVKMSEIDQFINEVAVLSQINHRNVVKLLGCCLETDVPLLIYEFISNGTLSDHLHVSQGESKLSWDDRLRIATESAGALAYLHSAASISIFHRDVKSSNILLDDTFRAKVSDFGASRFIPIDQTHIVTAIHGTFGYLDPEYYHTSQLTEKSDVYSFGVILLELLTGKKPINSTNDGSQQNLAMNFLQAMRENMLFDLIEDRILHEGTKQELLEISSLIKICLSLKGAERPTMKEVEYKLQGMRKTRMKKRGVCIPEGNEENEYLLNMSSHSSSELMGQIDQGNSRNYSLEKEIMWSQNYPR